MSSLIHLTCTALACGTFFSSTAIAQQTAPAAEWFTDHNGSREESHGHSILECSDGGFLQIGETGFVGSNARILVVKTDSAGSLAWKKEFGTSNRNMGNSAIEVDDGYLIAGMLSRNSALIKLDKATGTTIFQKTCDNGGADAFEHLAETPNGILAVGYRQAEDPDNTFFVYGQGYISFLDQAGNFISGQSVNAYLSQAYRIKPAGNDFIISGGTEDALQYGVIKVNSTGSVLWNKTFGGSNEDHCFGMDLGTDGSIFLAGHTLSGTANWDTYTMKLDPSGNQLWEAKQGNPRGFNPTWIHDETWGIKATSDGGCIISAGTGDEYAYSACNAGVCSDQWEAYIVKFSASGTVDWQATYGGSPGEDWAAEDIDLTSDGGAIVAVDNSQFGFLKLESFLAPGTLTGDLNGDGCVTGADLSILLAAWGTNGGTADLDGDGVVGGTDLTTVLSVWNTCL